MEQFYLVRSPSQLERLQCSSMRLRELNVGCLGGGTGLPSLLGGLKRNPWLRLHAVVTMFDSGGSSGQLRDELGVLPPGDVLKCALALSRNEGEARRVLLARLPTLEHARLSGHTGGNLLLSMMERYSGDFLAAVDGLRSLLGCTGRVWPVTVDNSTICAEYLGRQHDARRSRGGRGAGARAPREADLARAPPDDPSGSDDSHSRLRRRRHRSGQLLDEPDAPALRRRSGGSDRRARTARSCSSPTCSPKAAG